MRKTSVLLIILLISSLLFGCGNKQIKINEEMEVEEEPTTEKVSEIVDVREDSVIERTWKDDASQDEIWMITRDFMKGNSSGNIRSMMAWVDALRPYYDDNLFAKEVVDRYEQDNISDMTDIQRDFLSGYVYVLFYGDLLDCRDMKVSYAYAAGYLEDGSVSSDKEYNYRSIFIYVRDTIKKVGYDYSNKFAVIPSFEDDSMSEEAIERHGFTMVDAEKLPSQYGIEMDAEEGILNGEENVHLEGLKFFTIDNTQFNDILRNSTLIEFVKEYKYDVFPDLELIKKDTMESTDKPNTENNEPVIGMTEDEVSQSSWGSPKKKNIDTYEWGTKEQWVYDRGYIYLENGVVTGISNR